MCCPFATGSRRLGSIENWCPRRLSISIPNFFKSSSKIGSAAYADLSSFEAPGGVGSGAIAAAIKLELHEPPAMHAAILSPKTNGPYPHLLKALPDRQDRGIERILD
jgi:hypothetical protein